MAFDAATYEIDPLTLTTPRARLEYLRDFLRRLPRGRFYIGNYVSRIVPIVGHQPGSDTAELGACGTAACIAGWAAHLFQSETLSAVVESSELEECPVHAEGARLLGLSDADAYNLFVPVGCGAPPWSTITNQSAAAVIDHLLNTGEVDWSAARRVEA